jgi:DNA mismatch repair protein MutL
MGRIHVLSEHVANKIAAGEVIERPASVAKELLENSLDAGATRIRVNVEAGGKKLIEVIDNGCGMGRDDALLAFERHATSKLKNPEDLLSISTLGFRGEALPSVASVSRLRLETRAAEDASGTVIEIAGGKILKVEDAGLPQGTSIAVRDLFFNTPARKKFLKAESTELSHIASLVTHYALAHPDKHWELHTSTHAMLVAAPVAAHADRIYQLFGKETLTQLLPLAATVALERAALPPARRGEGASETVTGDLRLHGFVSKPELQKLNRNSIFIFVNGRLVRDRLVQHALSEAYRNIIPPTVFPVVLLFLEMPFAEVDVNVHPSKTEVRFRQQGFVHDFVRESVRAALMRARPAPHFVREIHAQPTSGPALTPDAGLVSPTDLKEAPEAAMLPNKAEAAGAGEPAPGAKTGGAPAGVGAFSLAAPGIPAQNAALPFVGSFAVEANAAAPAARFGPQGFGSHLPPAEGIGAADFVPERAGQCGPALESEEDGMDLSALATLQPLGQVRDSFILAVNHQGLWIIDQHVAHERVLFEKLLRARLEARVESQRLLMPLIVELTPGQLAVFAEIAEELERNGFEAEPFGARTLAVKTAPSGIDPGDLERLLHELLEQIESEQQAINLEKLRTRIAASVACHAAIKINTPLDAAKMEWLLRELASTRYPMSCPHGRPVVLRYSVKDIQKAFKRI